MTALPMTEPEHPESAPPEDAAKDEKIDEPKRPDDAPSTGDIAAIGIGCLVFVIFFVAIVIVGMMRDG